MTGKSRFEPAGHIPVGGGCMAEATGLPDASMQRGFKSPFTRSGTATASTFCLSAIDDELSTTSNRSILFGGGLGALPPLPELVTDELWPPPAPSPPPVPHPMQNRRPATAVPTASSDCDKHLRQLGRTRLSIIRARD